MKWFLAPFLYPLAFAIAQLSFLWKRDNYDIINNKIAIELIQLKQRKILPTITYQSIIKLSYQIFLKVQQNQTKPNKNQTKLLTILNSQLSGMTDRGKIIIQSKQNCLSTDGLVINCVQRVHGREDIYQEPGRMGRISPEGEDTKGIPVRYQLRISIRRITSLVKWQ